MSQRGRALGLLPHPDSEAQVGNGDTCCELSAGSAAPHQVQVFSSPASLGCSSSGSLVMRSSRKSSGANRGTRIHTWRKGAEIRLGGRGGEG